MGGWFAELQFNSLEHALMALFAPQRETCAHKRQQAIYPRISS